MRMHSYRKAGLVLAIIVVLLTVGCNETFRPIANPIPLPGGDPGSTDYVAVLSKNPSGARDIVTFINVSGDTNSGNRQVGPGAVYASWDASKAQVLTANSIDTVTAASYSSVSVPTASLKQGSSPVFITARISGTAYVINQGTNDDCPLSPSLGAISTSVISLVQNICLRDGSGSAVHPVAVAQTPNGSKLIVLDDTLNQAFVVNVGSSTVEARLNVGSGPVAAYITSDSRIAYVLNRDSNDISLVDLSADTVYASTIATGGIGPVAMTGDPILNRLYVVNRGSNSLSVFDVSNQAAPAMLHAPVGVGPAPSGVAVLGDGSAAYVANTGANYITRIDANSYGRKDIVVNTAPGATVVSVSTPVAAGKVYAATVDPTDSSNGTAIVRASDNTLVTTIPAPQQDLNCAPAAGPPAVTCPLARPAQLLSRK